MNTSFKALLLVLPLVADLHAEPIYKIVDDQGKVTYTSTPPDDKENTSTVNVAPEPSEDRINAAKQRHEQNIKAGELMDENRTERNKIVQEENRIKKEKQKQMQQQNKPAEEYQNTQHYGYPYYPRRRPGKPIERPPTHLPARPLR